MISIKETLKKQPQTEITHIDFYIHKQQSSEYNPATSCYETP